MLSLVIPTYNRLPHLKECINSFVEGIGNYPYEIIIPDGGSTDGTIEYLKNVDNDNIKLIEPIIFESIFKTHTGITETMHE